MKKSFVLCLALAVGTLASFPQVSQSQGWGMEELPQSLRGSRDIDEFAETPTWKRLPPDHEPIQRNFVQQPPIIPHKVEGYRITLRYNKCLTCHSWANYLKANATKISTTHFKDSYGNDLANIAPRHYFCNQCHAPQVDADPLVENTFEPVQTLQQR
jgi:cytochrome c-type protein NapB